ncbi:MAG: PRD domain-containing protein [Erysipelotrichaceae bacterium]|nr:PRD domain-containing protein [Erysipelotrichaceae bacterium]
MDFSERLDLYKEGGMISDADIEDINAVVDLFRNEYGVVLEEENAGTFIAHLCAAYGRLVSKEEVDELPEEVVAELESLDTYEESKQILQRVMEVTKNPLNETEQGYALLHINNLIAQFKEQGDWHA